MSHALRHRRPAARVVVALAALALVAAGCGDDDDDVASAPTTTAAPTSTTASAASGDDYGGSASAPSTEDMTADTGGNPELTVADTALGRVLVADGMTLYAFTPDTGGVSTCYDDCASAWPPLVASGEVEVGGDLDPQLFGTAPRTDGTEQVTVDGQPLYFFASDAAPGDTNGQGVGEKWYVVGPDGGLITG